MKPKVEMMFRGLFLEDSEKFSHPESLSRVSNHTERELFYSHIFSMTRRSLHTRRFRYMQLSVFIYELMN